MKFNAYLTLFAIVLSCSSAPPLSSDAYIVIGNKVFLRSGPGRSFPSIETLDLNSRVKLLRYGTAETLNNFPGRWAEVATNGKTGWVYDRFIMSDALSSWILSKTGDTIGQKLAPATLHRPGLDRSMIGTPDLVNLRVWKEHSQEDTRILTIRILDGVVGECEMSYAERKSASIPCINLILNRGTLVFSDIERPPIGEFTTIVGQRAFFAYGYADVGMSTLTATLFDLSDKTEYLLDSYSQEICDGPPGCGLVKRELSIRLSNGKPISPESAIGKEFRKVYAQYLE